MFRTLKGGEQRAQSTQGAKRRSSAKRKSIEQRAGGTGQRVE